MSKERLIANAKLSSLKRTANAQKVKSMEAELEYLRALRGSQAIEEFTRDDALKVMAYRALSRDPETSLRGAMAYARETRSLDGAIITVDDGLKRIGIVPVIMPDHEEGEDHADI